MGWVKIDDGMPLHPKMIGLSCNAVTLWLRSLCYASRYTTDGFVPQSALQHLTEPIDNLNSGTEIDEAISGLIDCGAWEERDDGYSIVNYLNHQTCRKDIEAKKAQTRERVARHRCNAPVTQMKRTCNADVTVPETETEAHKKQHTQIVSDELIRLWEKICGLTTESTMQEFVSTWTESWVMDSLLILEAKNPRPKNAVAYMRSILQGWRADGKPSKLPGGVQRPINPTKRKAQDPLDYCEHCGAYVGKHNRIRSVGLASGIPVIPRCRECQKELECSGEAANAK